MYTCVMGRHTDILDAQWAILEPLLPKVKRRTDGKGRPRRSNREILNGVLWILRTSARWCDLPERYPPYQTCHRRFQEWVRSGVLRGMLETLARDLQERGKFNLAECFIDATFVVAKKGAPALEKPSGARGPSSWQWQTALVFLSPSTLHLLRRMNSPLFEQLSRSASFELDPDDSSVIERMTLIRSIGSFNRLVSNS